MFKRPKSSSPKTSRSFRAHEVDSWEGFKPSDEASYYEGDRFEMGGVDFGEDRKRNRSSRKSSGESFDYWDEGVGIDYSSTSRKRSQKPHQHGWDRPGRRASDYGTTQERIYRYTSRTDYHGSPDNDELDIIGDLPDHTGKGPKGYARADERIREEVCEALFDSHDVDAQDIMVDVEAGKVILRGTVTDRKTKKLAERTIEHLPGVKDVRNEITILARKPGEKLSNREIQDLDNFKMA